MKFTIKHEIKGRIRIHVKQKRMTYREVDTLYYYLSNLKFVTSVKVRERMQDATITYVGDREALLEALCKFRYENVEVPAVFLETSGRELNAQYWEKLVNQVVLRMGSQWFLPAPVRTVFTVAKSVKYIWEGIRTLAKGKIEVSAAEIQPNDKVLVHMGNVIPFDGTVVDGEAMVNQASLTGESLPVHKSVDGYVYAGTVVEEGELTIRVKEVGGSSKFEKIVTMIEESEKLKSSVEGKAEHLADKLVPYTLLGTGLTYLFTRNVTKALSVLMVDFSCALKLAMPITVLSAIREASLYDITVKGGKFLEAMAEADTIVFDKTGTLTKAQPTVVDVISFNGENSDELLRIAACMEEHFPHSMAKAVVDAAKKKNLEHEETHTKVEYIVAHGISTTIEGKKAIMIGDGINDSLALSAADVGIAISDGAEIAREIADVTIGADNLYEIVNLKAISNGLMKRIHKNYRMIVGINAGLIVLGVAGIIPPTTSALLHNTSTLAISLKSTQNILT